ncbi:MAG: ACP S-malonyltransferase [Desulfobulbaceae bacterium]|nr:ACP S-malonyltransferase [Desulfobulbaceae bacterium]
MKKTAVIFPGQGSQYIGMGLDFVNQDPDASTLMDLAEKISGFPLRQLCFAGPLEDLTRVLYLQPALTVVNLICWQQLNKRLPGFVPSFLAGHSLGEYSALFGAGVLNLADTLRLVTKRGELMEREGTAHPGGMRAIVGLSIEEVEDLLVDFSGPGVAVVANHNTATQVVLSGDTEGLDAVGERCSARGAKVIPLKVSVANHSPLVAGAVEDFAAYMSGVSFQPPEIPVLFNVTGRYEAQPLAMKSIMARQIASRVRWLEIVNQMVAEEVEVIVELGPKNVLTGMMKKILPKNSGIICMQADSPETLDKVAEVLVA